MIPTTVPKRPMNGAVEPIVARNPRPRFNWISVSAMESSERARDELERVRPDRLRSGARRRTRGCPPRPPAPRGNSGAACAASISSWTSPPWRNFPNTGLNICDWREAARKRRCLSTITPTEKMDSRARQAITAPPNSPTFPNSSVKLMASSFAPQRAAPHSPWSAHALGCAVSDLIS